MYIPLNIDNNTHLGKVKVKGITFGIIEDVSSYIPIQGNVIVFVVTKQGIAKGVKFPFRGEVIYDCAIKHAEDWIMSKSKEYVAENLLSDFYFDDVVDFDLDDN